jgi:hypothetical protein
VDAGARRDGGVATDAEADAAAVAADPDAAQPEDGGPPPILDCAARVPPLPGYVRKAMPSTFVEVERVSPAGTFWMPFPVTGQFGRLFTASDETITLRFETPTDAAAWAATALTRQAFWDQSQVDGPANLNYVYVTISTCPGDFRVPVRGATAPASDPTFARGCTNFRDGPLGSPVVASNIPYVIGDGPSTESTCVLAPGTTYYLNFVRASPADGVIGRPEEELPSAGDRSNCNNPDLASCGVQMRVE